MTTTQLNATIRSEQPVTLETLDQFTDAISYTKNAEVKFHGDYYTEILIIIDLEAAEKDQTEYESTEENPQAWTGNIWDWLEDGPFSRMNEDGVLPDGCDWTEDIEINGMTHWEYVSTIRT